VFTVLLYQSVNRKLAMVWLIEVMFWARNCSCIHYRRW